MMDPLVQRPEHRTHHLPSVLKTLTNLIGIVRFFHVDTKHNLGRNLRMSANMSGGKSVQMMTADVNATGANVFFTTLVGLPTPPRHRSRPNPPCWKQHGGNKRTEPKELLQRRVMLQLTGRSDPSPAHAPPTTNETLRDEIVRITCTSARDTNTCRCVRELKQFDATLKAR